jgi:hypothetical protein
MPLYKELKGGTGKYMSKKIPGVAEDKHKAGEFPQRRVIDKAPVNLGLFTGQKGKGMIYLPLLLPERSRILHHEGIADIQAPVFEHATDLLGLQCWIVSKPTADQ